MAKRGERGWGRGQSAAAGGIVLLALGLPGWTGCVSARRAAEMEAAAAAQSELAGKPAIDFVLPNQHGTPVSLTEQRGQWVVLYFYPADGTPGCTCQAREFTQYHKQFERLNAAVFGISPDSVESHRQVFEEYDLRIDLLADPERKVMEPYGAWVKTPFGGRVIRSTVLIDPQGRIAYHWPEVIPEGHAERVKAKLEELQAVSG